MSTKCTVVNCNLCEASYYRKHIVNGYGNINGDIMIIGESPGYYEDKHGKPFVGYGGKYLRDTLKEVGFYKSNIYMTNVTKCKPRNTKVSAKEIKNCSVHLSAELHSMKPKVIILLGRTAHDVVLGKSKLSLSVLNKNVVITKRGTYIFTIYHPSYVLANPQLFEYYVKTFAKIYRIYTKYINPYYKFQNNLI
jgi:DNA polymerase